jgi:anhydro-N-acetylmuramic acid kinase
MTTPNNIEGNQGIYIGLMSGTSLDGITTAIVRFQGTDPVKHELISFTLHPFTPAQRARLLGAMHGTTPEEYCRLNFDLGEWFADSVVAAIAEAGIARTEIRAIASHGQTLWHVPGHSTWQIGEGAVIAERTGIPVIDNFRVRDVASGGQGAPLVPIADALLYSNPEEWRLLQNIGGMANVTVVPPKGDLNGVRAFDTGPGVAVLDAVVRELYPSLPYDIDGTIAARGAPNREVLDELLTDPYFALQPPKSTGREHFGLTYAQQLIANCHKRQCTEADIVATATMLTAETIALAYRRFLPEPAKEVVISGGGAKNPALVNALRALVAPRVILSFDELYYDGEAKEAVAFALLAHLHLHGKPGNVIGATGARGPRVLGALNPA